MDIPKASLFTVWTTRILDALLDTGGCSASRRSEEGRTVSIRCKEGTEPHATQHTKVQGATWTGFRLRRGVASVSFGEVAGSAGLPLGYRDI